MPYRNVASSARSKSPASVHSGSHVGALAINTSVANGSLSGEASAFKPSSAAKKHLLHDSMPDDGPLIVHSVRPGDTTKSQSNGMFAKHVPSAIGTKDAISPTQQKVYYTTDVVPEIFIGGHYMKFAIPAGRYDYFKKHIGGFSWKRLARAFCAKLDPDGRKMIIHVAFDDFRNTGMASRDAQEIETTVDTCHINQQEFKEVQVEAYEKQASEAWGKPSALYDGQVIYYAQFNGPISRARPDNLQDLVMAFASQFGDVLSLGELECKDGIARFRAEYYSIDVAKEVVKQVTKAKPGEIEGWLLFAQDMGDYANGTESNAGSSVAGSGSPVDAVRSKPSSTFYSLTGRTAWSVNQDTGAFARANQNGSQGSSPSSAGAMILHKPQFGLGTPLATFGPHTQQYGPRYGPFMNQQFVPATYNPSTFNTQGAHMHADMYRGPNSRGRLDHAEHSQTVDADVIRQGLDVRTTIMIRNLPNQMTCHHLKALLDASNFGEYDFSYVRIDYQKGASVGYGFINFTTPEAIIKFVEAHVGKPWMPCLANRRGAARVADISYATVQGYDCCVEKFRNSSVMIEFVDYRPKLWYTYASAPSQDVVGKEKPFPPVNNASKHQRSLANATQIGLFPPQARRVLSGFSAATRSQFDRGTTAQQQEDLMTMMQQQMLQMQGNMFPHGPSNLLPAAPMAQAGPMIPYQGAPAHHQHEYFGPGPMLGQHAGFNMPGHGAMMAPNGFHPAMPNMAAGAQFHGFPSHPVLFPQAARGRGGYGPAMPRAFGQRAASGYGPNSYRPNTSDARNGHRFGPIQEADESAVE